MAHVYFEERYNTPRYRTPVRQSQVRQLRKDSVNLWPVGWQGMIQETCNLEECGTGTAISAVELEELKRAKGNVRCISCRWSPLRRVTQWDQEWWQRTLPAATLVSTAQNSWASPAQLRAAKVWWSYWEWQRVGIWSWQASTYPTPSCIHQSDQDRTSHYDSHWVYQQRLRGVCSSSVCWNNLRIFTGWWFQICFIFNPTWENDPIWLIFFKWVETTSWIHIFQRTYLTWTFQRLVKGCHFTLHWDFFIWPYRQEGAGIVGRVLYTVYVFLVQGFQQGFLFSVCCNKKT